MSDIHIFSSWVKANNTYLGKITVFKLLVKDYLADFSSNENTKNGVKGSFLLLKTVKALQKKIARDPRHSNVRILAEGEKEERTFDHWTMAFTELTADEARTISDLIFEDNFLTFSQLVSKPTHAIRSFWNRAQNMINVS